MRSFKIFTLFISIFLSLRAFAVIKETYSMRDVARYITPGTLVIFDLDNTVLEAVQTLGTDQFFSYLVKKAEKQGHQGQIAKEIALRQATFIQPVTRVQLVEKITAELIKLLQNNRYSIFALTARPVEWTTGTLKQVASLGIDFSNTAPRLHANSFQFHGGNYHRGVFFLPSRAEKGPTLLTFLKQSGISANKIIFIDDKLNNVQSVDTTLTHAGIPILAFRYGAADARVKSFNEKLAEFEYKYFLKFQIFLPDDVALKMMN